MINKNDMLVGALVTGAVALAGGVTGYLANKKKQNKLLQQIVDGTAEELNKQLNEEIIEKNKFARIQLIKKAEEEREEMIKDINEKLEINRLKREMMERVDKEVVDKLLEENNKLVKEAKYERDQMKRQHAKEIEELKKERENMKKDYDKMLNNMFRAFNNNGSNNNGERKDLKDLDYMTRYRIDEILKDDKLSGAEKAALIEALR